MPSLLCAQSTVGITVSVTVGAGGTKERRAFGDFIFEDVRAWCLVKLVLCLEVDDLV